MSKRSSRELQRAAASTSATEAMPNETHGDVLYDEAPSHPPLCTRALLMGPCFGSASSAIVPGVSHRLRLTPVAGFVDVAATVSQKRGYVSVSPVPVGGLRCPTVPLLQLPLSNATVFVRVFSALVLFQPVAVCLRARVGWFSALRP